MSFELIKVVCLNPECSEEYFYPSRSNQIYCCINCKNRASYIKRQQLLKNRYADVVNLLKIDRILERIFTINKECYTYSSHILEVLGIPIDAAVKIGKNESQNSYVHYFSNYGIESNDGKNYRIIKRSSNDR